MKKIIKSSIILKNKSVHINDLKNNEITNTNNLSYINNF